MAFPEISNKVSNNISLSVSTCFEYMKAKDVDNHHIDEESAVELENRKETKRKERELDAIYH